jgi:hypothetical protein
VTEWTQNRIRYGSEFSLPKTRRLRAGPLTMEYAQGDLRNIRRGKQTLLRRLYAAVRDKDWSTVPSSLTHLEESIQEDSFRMMYISEHKQGDIHFVWRGTLIGSREGILTFTFDGEAITTFERNRIGFCILHPAECAGVHALVEHTDGTQSEAVFPEFIDPDQPVHPFEEMRALTLFFDEAQVRIEMEGDIFEMEDQRNWTDASYKTFCTPLRLPFPVTLPAGTRIRQQITLTVSSTIPSTVRTLSSVATELRLSSRQDHPLPAFGSGLPRSSELPEELSLQRLQQLSLSHLRLELHLAQEGWKADLEQGARWSRILNVPLEVALLLSDPIEPGLSQLRAECEANPIRAARWLALPLRENLKQPQPWERWLPVVRRALESLTPGASFVAGSGSDFIFLNRFPPRAEGWDALTFAINPQVHAFDNTSLMETLTVQSVVLRSVKRHAQGRPILISPITLLPRFNPYSADQMRPSPPIDARHASLFGAAWTLGSLCAMIEGEAAAITYYEAMGEGGIINADFVYPLYHIFADFAAYKGGRALPLQTSDALQIIGLVLEKAGQRRILLANLTPETQDCRLIEIEGNAMVRRLDETSFTMATQLPEAYRQEARAPLFLNSDTTLSLLPYAVCCLDFNAAL